MVSERAVHKLAIDGGEVAISEPQRHVPGACGSPRRRRSGPWSSPHQAPVPQLRPHGWSSKTEELESRSPRGSDAACDRGDSCSSALYCALMGLRRGAR